VNKGDLKAMNKCGLCKELPSLLKGGVCANCIISGNFHNLKKKIKTNKNGNVVIKNKFKFLNLAVNTPHKLPNIDIDMPFPILPKKFEVGIKYRFENTTTRNAYWIIWCECIDKKDNIYDVFVDYGAIGTAGKVSTLYTDLTLEGVSGYIKSRINGKIKHNYVYKTAVPIKTKGFPKSKQKDPPKVKEIQAIDVDEVAKNMFQRIIKVI
jgi:hypothetical protein